MDTLLRETVNAVVNSRFPEMSIEGRRQIESILIREEYPKGVIALNEGEVAHELVFVGKGMLRQYYYKNGKDVTEHFSYEGCILMCIESLLKQVPTRLIIETLEPAVIYLFPYDKMMQLTKQNWGNQYVLSEDTGIFSDCIANQSRFLAFRIRPRAL